MTDQPTKRRQEQLDRARRDADQATANYRPTCCDLLDLQESMWVNDTYLAAGTYVCDRWEGHDGYHGGATLQGYDERGDELAPDWPGREAEVSWDDRNPNRRVNR